MLLLDVNIVLGAVRPDIGATGPAVRRWLEDALNGTERVALSDVILASTVRLATNPRMMRNPSGSAEAFAAVDEIRSGPASAVVAPTSRHWGIFGRLVTTYRLRDNDVPDAWLAALALDHGATLVTLDRGFARFEGVRTLNPVA